ncbi:PAS domain S-box protein [Desulfococcaceae bacterium HSG7]|nr:PAS domain S-box protein [Desulfococcaceae bacterium HSG7]
MNNNKHQNSNAPERPIRFQHSIIFKLIGAMGLILLLIISIWAYFNIRYQKKIMMEGILDNADQLSTAIRLGAHYAMMLNSRDDINQIIKNIGRQEKIKNIRIYNKQGEIKFSNIIDEIDRHTEIKDEACFICHKTKPPAATLELNKRIRIIHSSNGHRLLGIISPIYNEPGCSTNACHFHPQDKVILGALDLVVSMEETDLRILFFKEGVIALAITIFLFTSVMLYFLLIKFVTRPITNLIQGATLIAQGDYANKIEYAKGDEMGRLTLAVNRMAKAICEKQAEINNQRREYQNLFEGVPCIITVQDRNYKLLRYNKEFADKFQPTPGEYCYNAYKGRSSKCLNCPVEMTFADGLCHNSEEKGTDKDGNYKHWIVRTSPIKDANGEIVAAMEMCLDVTLSKQLQEKLKKSEKKYYTFFNNISNPAFVLDADSFEILDCNKSVASVYGFSKEEMIGQSYLTLFADDEKERYIDQLKRSDTICQVKHWNKDNLRLYVDIWIAPFEYPGRKVFLVTASDITKRLEAEQQLNQAGKMATLGEMATGVAHELNQPLTVIKTAGSFFLRKLRRKETVADDVFLKMSQKIDNNVDRATKIINHMRQFARKSDVTVEPVQVNTVLEKASEMFSQQLKVRGIDVIADFEDDLPLVMADPGRLEQVFVNLLINARHAIEDQDEHRTLNIESRMSNSDGNLSAPKSIRLTTFADQENVIIQVCDTGAGIPQAIRNKIFEPFFTTKEVGKGTGLGLSISYGIIKEFRGDIRAESNNDKGACFVISLPFQNV